MAPQCKNVARNRPGIAQLCGAAVAAIVYCLGLTLAACGSEIATSPEVHLPEGIVTHDDGRLPIEKLYATYLGLVDKGWHLEVIMESQPAGTAAPLPIIALRSPRPGTAVWILSGIHGEEPAGPNAIAAAVEDLAGLGERMPVVLVPLCNPQGYVRNWRYLNTPEYSETIEGESVGDSSHLLPESEDSGMPRAAAASSSEADALTRYLVRLAESYPPRYSIDLHEDDYIAEGYVYSQGELGVNDHFAIEAIKVLGENGIPIKLEGKTRFGEEIVGGIIGPVNDSSIDELIEARKIVLDGRIQAGPAAQTVLVFETPAKDVELAQRTAAHLALLRRLAALIASEPGSTPPP